MKKPICLNCQSDNITRPGFCSFRYIRGRWTMEKRSPALAETDSLHCQDCGASLSGGFNPPFTLSIESIPMEMYSTTTEGKHDD